LLSFVMGPYTQVDLRWRFNAGPWHDRNINADEAASQDQSKSPDANYPLNSGNLAQIIDVPVSELVAGDNTLELATMNSPNQYPTVLANIDLVLETSK
jgi:hypothetical protein